ADPADLFNAWQDAIRQLGRATAPLTGPPVELLEQVMRRQVDFEKELLGRLLAPVNTAIDALEQTSSAMHTQAEAVGAGANALERTPSGRRAERRAAAARDRARTRRAAAPLGERRGGRAALQARPFRRRGLAICRLATCRSSTYARVRGTPHAELLRARHADR